MDIIYFDGNLRIEATTLFEAFRLGRLQKCLNDNGINCKLDPPPSHNLIILIELKPEKNEQ